MDFIPFIGALVIAIVFAAVCWNLAGARDRNQVMWAILGFLFPIIALIVLLIIGKSKPAASA
jgi:hypothetical protein